MAKVLRCFYCNEKLNPDEQKRSRKKWNDAKNMDNPPDVDPDMCDTCEKYMENHVETHDEWPEEMLDRPPCVGCGMRSCTDGSCME